MSRLRGRSLVAVAVAALAGSVSASSRSSAGEPLPLATSPASSATAEPTQLPTLPPPGSPAPPALPLLPAPSAPPAPPAGSASPQPLPLARPLPPGAPCGCDSDCTPCQDPKPRTPESLVIGLRLQLTQTRAPAGGAGDAVGASIAGRFESHNDERSFLASRGELGFGLGGGTGGVEGLFGGAVLVGARLPIARHHAPFLRVGLAGEYQGNNRYLWSRFDLPLGELGYQYVRVATLFEIGGRLSPVLTGRFRAESATRALSEAFSFGGFLTARGTRGRVDLLYTRVLPSHGSTGPVDSAQGLACWLPFSAFAVCLDGQLVTSTFGPSEGALRAGYAGALLGLGAAGMREAVGLHR